MEDILSHFVIPVAICNKIVHFVITLVAHCNKQAVTLGNKRPSHFVITLVANL